MLNDSPAAETLILQFGTTPHEIDARTLLGSFGALETALRAIAADNHPATVIRIKVKPFQKGSFEVPIEIQQSLAATGLVLSSIDWPNVRASITILIDLIKISLALKGEKPKKANSVERNLSVTNSKNVQLNVDQRSFKLYMRGGEAVEALKNAFQTMDADKDIKSFTLLDRKRKKLVRVSRRSFPFLSKRRVELQVGERRITERVTLSVFKVVFDDGYKWEFYYRGFKIAAELKDERFAKKVRMGTRFGRGDALDVDLETVQRLDETVKQYVNKAYFVSAVHEIIPCPTQPELRLEEQ